MSAQHVLIVEDSLVYRRLLSRMLTQWGYIVSEAENGKKIYISLKREVACRATSLF